MFKESIFKTALKKFAGPHIYDRILKYGRRALKPGIKYNKLTAYVQYLGGINRGWSAERFSPEQYLKFLSEYLTIMTECIQDHDGILTLVDSNMIMAVWKTDEMRQYLLKTADCALECVRQGTEFSKKWTPNEPDFFTPNIGLSRGPLVLGNFGSDGQLFFIATGDALNIAAVMAKANREYGSHIQVSEFFKSELEHAYILRLIDHLKVRGYNRPIKAYELLNSSSEKNGEIRDKLDMFDKGIVHYMNRKFDKAEFYFKKLVKQNPEDQVSMLYMNRCQTYKKNPPGQDWDGVYRSEM